jgi:hydrogenase/urease accessory protein HupE
MRNTRPTERRATQRRALGALLAIAMCLFVPVVASAHGIRSGSLRIDALSPTHALVRWSTTVPDAAVQVILPVACTASSEEEVESSGFRVWSLDCPHGIAGATFSLHGLGPQVSEATLLAHLADGRTLSHLLTSDTPSWSLPSTQSPLEVSKSYLLAGVVHIATGADHLLFLTLLVLLLRRPRAVLIAETAFTLSHSIAFSLTALGWIHVPAAPAEVCIALSLVLLALDVEAEPTIDARRGALAALVFGVVHGLGFAGGLAEAGLPDQHVALALAGFGAGVEIGQVAFLVVLLSLVALASRWRAFPRLVPVAATGIGSFATAWLIERLVVAFSV